MRTQRSESSSDATASSTAANGSDKVRRHSSAGGGRKSLLVTVWTLIKTVFFTIVHIYRSLTAFWSQMHVCMLPALGELDSQEELDAQAQQDLLDADHQNHQATSAGSPKRKRASKEL